MILKIIRKGKPNCQHKPLSLKCHVCKEFDIFPPTPGTPHAGVPAVELWKTCLNGDTDIPSSMSIKAP